MPTLDGARIEIELPAEARRAAPQVEAAVRGHFRRVAAARRVEAHRLRLHGWRVLGLGLLVVALLFGVPELLSRSRAG